MVDRSPVLNSTRVCCCLLLGRKGSPNTCPFGIKFCRTPKSSNERLRVPAKQQVFDGSLALDQRLATETRRMNPTTCDTDVGLGVH